MMENAMSGEHELHSMDARKLIPHGEAFRMVDRMLCCNEKQVVVETLVRPDSPFCESGSLASTALLENIAQTCAVRMGFLYSSVTAGVIAAVKRMDIFSEVKVGDVLRTEVLVDAEAFGMMSCTGRIERGGSVVAEAELKLMV
jgi:predicted hotdog family 3-hydroxylacyl-ACP dehydratase